MTETNQPEKQTNCPCRTACILGGIDACTLPLDHDGPHRTEGRTRVCSWPQGPGWEPDTGHEERVETSATRPESFIDVEIR